MKRPVENPAWEEELRRLFEHDVRELWDASRCPHVYNQYQNQLSVYRALAPEGMSLRILDVGCAQATLAMLLAEAGHKVLAVDLRQNFLDYAKSRYEFGDIEFVCGNALELDLDYQFDLIFANQIIEHLVYPEVLIQRLRAHLAPGGRLVVSTPNALYVRNGLPTFSELGDRAALEHRQFTADGDGHFFAYTQSELTELFRNAPLSNVRARVFETPIASGHMKLRYLTGRLPVALVTSLDRKLASVPWFGSRISYQLMVTGILQD